MADQKTISFRMDAQKVEALDVIAVNMQRDRTFLLNEAVDAYIEWNAEFEQRILEGMKAAREGRLIEHSEVRKRMAQLVKKRKTA
jgi:predicted transcriptional regulator